MPVTTVVLRRALGSALDVMSRLSHWKSLKENQNSIEPAKRLHRHKMARKSGSRKKKPAKATSPPRRTGHLLLSDVAGTGPVVVTGGYSDVSSGLMDLWSYTTIGGWVRLHMSEGSAASASPLPRVNACGAMVGDKVYLFGGMQQQGQQMLVFNDLWEFSLELRQW